MEPANNEIQLYLLNCAFNAYMYISFFLEWKDQYK